MKTYAINLVVDTKNTDIYDKAALNKFPLIVKCKTEAELKEILSTTDTILFVQNLIKSPRVFESASWMIRCIYENDVREIVWDLKEILPISNFSF
jgi:hypothetical protein